MRNYRATNGSSSSLMLVDWCIAASFKRVSSSLDIVNLNNDHHQDRHWHRRRHPAAPLQ